MGKTKAVQLSDGYHDILTRFVALQKLDGVNDVKITTTVEKALANYTPLKKFVEQHGMSFD